MIFSIYVEYAMKRFHFCSQKKCSLTQVAAHLFYVNGEAILTEH